MSSPCGALRRRLEALSRETLPTGKASRGRARAAPNKALVTGRAWFPLTAVARWIAARHRLLAVYDGHFGMGFRTSTRRFSSREVVAWVRAWWRFIDGPASRLADSHPYPVAEPFGQSGRYALGVVFAGSLGCTGAEPEPLGSSRPLRAHSLAKK
jgi:hypothetical protein